MEDSGPKIYRPRPLRPFELGITSPTPPDHSSSPSPLKRQPNDFASQVDAKLSESRHHADNLNETSRTKSILNLTASTLFGIYQPTEYNENASREVSEPVTPWGTGAETPGRFPSSSIGSASGAAIRESLEEALLRGRLDGRDNGIEARVNAKRRGQASKTAPVNILGEVARIAALFAFGLAYGVIISQLHENRHINPVKVENVDHTSWLYLVFWGLASIAFGKTLPWLDSFWEERTGPPGTPRRPGSFKPLAAETRSIHWNSVVRNIGAFAGIIFAIRKLPWESTLQVSLTLALANPILWYLLDRSKPGFGLSTFVGIIGTCILLFTRPDMVPSPALTPQHSRSTNTSWTGSGSTSGNEGVSQQFLGGFISYETIGVATWIASVLFCSCVCFGNIGRRLALSEPSASNIR